MTPAVLTALPAVTVAPVTSTGTFLTQSQPGGEGADFGKSSPVGLLLLLVFLVAVVFLVRSMTKHLKRVPASFDAEGDGADDRATDDRATDGAANRAADGGRAVDTNSSDDTDRVDDTAESAPDSAQRPVGDAGEAAATGRE